MGGCRCSYRTCKVRSDGQTHMFHFPVFDKMRCHQWIKNALKPNFLNLKLSQLKNRVICQHHFKDDNFMNFKRDKLKSDAVPTEDGPYCISEQIQTIITEECDKPAIPINADDIENEILNSIDKKAHSSVKYGDFLISDATELFNASHNNIQSQASPKKPFTKRHAVKNTTKLYNVLNSSDSPTYKPQILEDNNKYTIIYSNEDQFGTKSTNPLYFNKDAPNQTHMAIEFQENTKSTKSMDSVSQPSHSENHNPVINPDKMVKIIAEKKISEPVLVEGKLELISPSMILRPRKVIKHMLFEQNAWDVQPQHENDKSCINTNLLDNNNVVPVGPAMIFEQTLPIEYTPDTMEINANITQNHQLEQQNMIVEKQNPLNIITINNIENQNNIYDDIEKQNEAAPALPSFLELEKEDKEPLYKQSKDIEVPVIAPVYKSISKGKITPEKLAAIEQKRKFNMKLKDVITSCLDNLEEPNEVIQEKISQRKQKVQQSLLKEPIPTSSQGSIIAYLEARLQKMEDTLLHKIDHNTQRINDLKRTIKPSTNSRNANTQTYLVHMSEQSQKTYLYKEISKFLSPNANIKVYEELFMDKSSQVELEEATHRKLRKRR